MEFMVGMVAPRINNISPDGPVDGIYLGMRISSFVVTQNVAANGRLSRREID